MKCERCNQQEAGEGNNFCLTCFEDIQRKLGKVEDSRVNQIKVEQFNRRKGK